MAFNFNGEDLLALGSGLLSAPTFAQGAGQGFAGVAKNRKGRRKEAFQREQFDALKSHRAAQMGLSQQQLEALERYRGQTLDLRSRSLDMQQTQQTTANDLARQRLKLTQEQMNNPGLIREYKAAKQSGLLPEGTSYVDFLGIKKSSAETFSKAPVFGIDADGNTVLIQAGSHGTGKVMQLPEGVSPSTGVNKLDAGTHFVIQDKRTGQTIGIVPKNVADVETEKVKGKAKGEAITNLSQAEQNAQDTLNVIDQVADHPGLDSSMGAIQGRLPSFLASPTNPQNVDDFRNIKAQLEGKAFLQAFESLKGGGQITEIEGQKATEAIAVLRDTTSEAEFRKQLGILRGIVKKGVARARSKAQQPAQPQKGQWQDLGNGVKIREKN